MVTFFSFLSACLVAYLSTPLFRLLAVKLRFLDLPNKRKIHKSATPLLGGLAIYSGIIAGIFLNYQSFKVYLPILIGATIILIIGLADDKKKGGLSAGFRLCIQFLVTLILIYSNIKISFLPDTLWGDIGEFIFTMVWVIGVTNAFNYLDGMDGLATGSAAINAFCFALILFVSGQYQVSLLSAIIVGASLGFLPYNLKKAKIFLGDAGSTLLGFLLACIGLIGNWAEDHYVKITVPILILGVPIFDMIFTTIMRIKDHKISNFTEWLQYGGKDHFHHCLVDLGLSSLGAVIFIYFITISLGISAMMVSNDYAVEALLTLAQASVVFGVIAVLIVVGKRRRSGWN